MDHQRGQALPGAVVQLSRNAPALLILQLEQTAGEIAKCLFGIFSRSDVSVDFKDADRPSFLIVLQHLAACYVDSPSILPEVHQLAFPRTSAKQFFLPTFERLWKLSTEELMRYIAAGFGRRPTVSLLRPAIPEQNYAIHIANHDRIVGELQ